MKINIGCGRSLKEGWINADNTVKEKTKVWQEEQRQQGFSVIDMDGTAPWDFEAEWFDYVFSEHMIEHVPEKNGLFLLQEAYRTLKPGGVIRILAPERVRFERLRGQDNHPFVAEYHKVIWKGRPVQSGSASRIADRTLNEQGHVWVPTTKQLIDQIARAGFQDVKETPYGISEHEELNGVDMLEGRHATLRRFETVCVEGTK